MRAFGPRPPRWLVASKVVLAALLVVGALFPQVGGFAGKGVAYRLPIDTAANAIGLYDHVDTTDDVALRQLVRARRRCHRDDRLPPLFHSETPPMARDARH